MNRPPLYLDDARARGLGLNLPAPQAPAHVERPAPPWYGGGPPPSPQERGNDWYCNSAERVQLAGGALATLMVHPEVTPFERLYRKNAHEGMFSPGLSPSSPFAFELGAFQVPDNMTLLLFDLRPDIYRLSGVDAGDAVPVEARRFAGIMGFEILIDRRHPGNTAFEIEPQAVDVRNNPLAPFNDARNERAASAVNSGTGLLPQRPQRYGPLSVPFTLQAYSGQIVQTRCVFFRPLPSPIAFIEYDIAGLLLPSQWVKSMEECMKPLTHASGGPGSMGGGPR